MSGNRMSRDEVIAKIREILGSIDGVSLEDIFNDINQEHGDHSTVSYEGDSIFVKDQAEGERLTIKEVLDALASLHQDYMHALPEKTWDAVTIEKVERVLSKSFRIQSRVSHQSNEGKP